MLPESREEKEDADQHVDEPPSRVRLNPSLGQSVSSKPLVSLRNRPRDRRERCFSSTLIAGHPLAEKSNRETRANQVASRWHANAVDDVADDLASAALVLPPEEKTCPQPGSASRHQCLDVICNDRPPRNQGQTLGRGDQSVSALWVLTPT